MKGQKKSSSELDEIDNVSEKVTLIPFNETHKNIHATGGQTANESDEEEDDDGQQRVGCQ